MCSATGAINCPVHRRNGYLWLLERTDAIKFVDAKPFVKQERVHGIDPKTDAPPMIRSVSRSKARP
jgi:hypothetical protein